MGRDTIEIVFHRIATGLGWSLLAFSSAWAAQARGPGFGPVRPAEPEAKSPPNLLFVVLDDIAERDMPHLATPQLDCSLDRESPSVARTRCPSVLRRVFP